ncbi:hypothetical protein KFE25_008975 [Diacronema lutheri]|uniref:PH domain-containing protein n=1 Tax=Diacronema lutheri TaxID=2081491 RepID=A0A8J5Y3V0_DIALT|nr:hypothetical protein KFE25_008975 [Diacronema lutheri]
MAGVYGRGSRQTASQPWPHFAPPREVLRAVWPNIPEAALMSKAPPPAPPSEASGDGDALGEEQLRGIGASGDAPLSPPARSPARSGGELQVPGAMLTAPSVVVDSPPRDAAASSPEPVGPHGARVREAATTPGAFARSPRAAAATAVASCGGGSTALSPSAALHSASVQAQPRAAASLDVRLIDAREKRRQAERVALMRAGSVVFKYQRGEGGLSARLFAPRGEKRREERLLRLSADGGELLWAKPRSGGGASKLRLTHIVGVEHGHDTELFMQMLIVPDAAELCFSLVTAKRTYSFAALTVTQAEAWVVGLSVLRQLPMRRRGNFLWNELRLRTRAEAEGTGLGALLPRIARELDESRQERTAASAAPTPSNRSEADSVAASRRTFTAPRPSAGGSPAIVGSV